MIADKRFVNQPLDFWAHVRSISAGAGYSVPRQSAVKAPNVLEMVQVLQGLGLQTNHLVSVETVGIVKGLPAEFGG